jgi:DNA polymerase-3 subunit delta'
MERIFVAMAWDRIIGQQHLQSMLQQCIIGARIPQALLLSGSRGRGSVALAVEFAATVNCYSPVQSAGMIDACGRCQSCTQAKSLQHPNITIVTALPSGKIEHESDYKEDVLEEIREQNAEIAKDPYTTYRVTNANQIRIWQVRELNRSMALSTLQQGRRVVIIVDAEDMNSEAANGFLKTLEEPHAGVTIILTSSQPERLLQTVVSRCQELVVPPIDDEAIIEELLRRGECTEQDARIIATSCDGDMSAALEFIHDDIQEIRADVISMFRSALRGRDYRVGIADAADGVAEQRDKRRAHTYLRFMAIWLRDTLSIAHTGTTDAIINKDQEQTLVKFASAFGESNIVSALSSIELAAADIKRNVSIALTMTTLLLELRAALGSKAKS